MTLRAWLPLLLATSVLPANAVLQPSASALLRQAPRAKLLGARAPQVWRLLACEPRALLASWNGSTTRVPDSRPVAIAFTEEPTGFAWSGVRGYNRAATGRMPGAMPRPWSLVRPRLLFGWLREQEGAGGSTRCPAANCWL